MPKIIDGKLISTQIKDELKEEVARKKAEGKSATLAVIQVGNDPASTVYVGNKKKACAYIAENGLDLVVRPEIKEFIVKANESYRESGKCDVSLILSGIESDTSSVAAAIFEVSVEDPYKAAAECINRMRATQLEDELRELSAARDAHQITVDEYKLRYGEITSRLNGMR